MKRITPAMNLRLCGNEIANLVKSTRVAKALFVCALMLAPLAAASSQELPKYEVTGFRDARFGMTEQEVRSIINKSLGIKTADISSSANPVEGTNVLTVRVASLDPVPGPAQVAYIFGYGSKKLIQVNVIWGEDKPKEQTDPNALVTAGTRLERYFAGFAWRKDATRAGIPVGDNTVVLLSGEDEKKGAVRLIVEGVKNQMQREGNQTTSPEPKSPPKLIINYISNRENPDIAKIEKGKF
jgi:hypothetical protein